MLNKIKKFLKNNKVFMKVYIVVNKLYYSILTIISPTLNTKLRYRQVFKHNINLNNPKSFNEKLLWLKLNTYHKNKLVIQCADKYAVRKYVEDCGYGHILNELYYTYDKVEDIKWGILPNKFALKWNFGAGFNIICNDKRDLNIEESCKKLKKWGKSKCWLSHSEMQYKYADKKIICEKYLDSDQGFLPYDYKIYCFNGEPKLTLVCTERSKEVKMKFMDLNWNEMNIGNSDFLSKEFPVKPECFDEMIEICRNISKPFPFVRIDFYDLNGKPVLGEMTFTPAGCAARYYNQEGLNILGNMICLPEKYKEV